MKENSPAVLILGSRFDLTCDYVVAALRELDQSYLRLNSEDLPDVELCLDPIEGSLIVQRSNSRFRLCHEDLKSIYYRRPVFLRDYGFSKLGVFEKFQLYQWAAFIRNLMVFDKCVWVNHPTATYYAEHKAVQLQIAHRVGFSVPRTLVTNSEKFVSAEVTSFDKIVIKGLDTVLLRSEDTETFGFTSILDKVELSPDVLHTVPVTLQEPLLNKVDIRVTVVGEDVFAVTILADGKPIYGDWRRHKKEVRFLPLELPLKIQKRCISLLKEFDLIYGAIDLALLEEEFYFLEINPTGEWAWLVDDAGQHIDICLAKYLTQPIPKNEKNF